MDLIKTLLVAQEHLIAIGNFTFSNLNQDNPTIDNVEDFYVKGDGAAGFFVFVGNYIMIIPAYII